MRTETKSLAWALGCIAGLSVLQVWLWPAVADAVRDYATAQREQERAELLNQQAAQLAERLQAQQAALENVADVVPTTDALPFVVTKLEQEAVDRGLRLTLNEIFEAEPTATPSPAARSPHDARAVIARVYATGTAPNLLAWLDQLEHGVQLMTVPRWSMRALGNQTVAGEALYEMELAIELYVRGTAGLEQVRGMFTTQ